MTAGAMNIEDVNIDVGAIVGAVLSRWFRIVVLTVLACGLTYAVLYFVPKTYESSASILVEPRQNAFTSPASGAATGSNAAVTLESAVSSEIELIKSRDTLLSVIDSENLRSVPEFNGGAASPLGMVLQLVGRRPESRNLDEVVIDNLLSRLTVIRERDSAVISIIVSSREPELAARIANTLANAHVTRRASLSLSDTAEAGGWLEQEIVKLRERVIEAETAAANFRIDNDLFSGANNTSLLDQQLTNVATQITTAQERRNAAQTRATLIRGLVDAGQPIDGVPDVRESLSIQQLMQSRAELQRELAERSSTLLPNHPTIRALTAQIREIGQQIASEGRRIASALEASARIEADLEVSLQAELVRLKQTASRAATSTVTLDGLQREAKAQRDLLESYLLRYRDAISRAESSSELPAVRVITGAAPSNTPASPKVALTVGAVGFVVFAAQVGWIIFAALLAPASTFAAPPVVERREDPAPEAVMPGAPLSMPVAEPAAEPAITGPALPLVAKSGDGKERAGPGTVEAGASVSMSEAAKPAAAAVKRSATSPIAPAVYAKDGPGDDETAKLAAIAARTATAAATTAATLEAMSSGRYFIEPGDDVVAVDGSADKPRPAKAAKAEAPSGKAAAAPAATAAPAAERKPSPVRTMGVSQMASLRADIALGRTRVALLAALDAGDNLGGTASVLVDELLGAGLSVALLDAGSGRASREPGVTDLAAGRASFGDVVQRGDRDGLALVPWGRLDALDANSSKSATLVEALTDIYDAVVVVTGPLGKESTIPAFTGLEARLVLVAGKGTNPSATESARQRAADLGFGPVQLIEAAVSGVEIA